MFGRRPRVEDPVSTLARCITALDDTRAYRRKPVDGIEQTFAELKPTRFREHYDLWGKVSPYVEEIVDMPLKVQGVPGMIRALSWIKVLTRISIIVMIFFLAIQIVPAWRNALGPDFMGGNVLFYSLLSVVAVVGLLNLEVLVDYRIRKRIVAYESATVDHYATARNKLKDGVNRMMKSLAKEANRAGNKPEDFQMIIYFDDYDFMQVVKKWRPKSFGLFKKPYFFYQIMPRL